MKKNLMLEKLIENPNQTQNELNALYTQMLMDLNARLEVLEPPVHHFHDCVVCGSEFVVGMAINEDNEQEWVCLKHLLGDEF